MLISLLICTTFLLFLVLGKNKKLNDLSLILITSVFVVSIFFPILSYFEPPITWRNLSGLTLERVEYVQIQYLSFIIGAMCFYLSWGWKLDSLKSIRELGGMPSSKVSRFSMNAYLAVVLVSFGSVLYLAYIQSVGINTLVSSEAMTDKYKASSGKGFLYIGLNFLIWGVLVAETVRNRPYLKLVCRLLAIGVVCWALFFIHTRTYAAILVFGYFYLYVERNDLRVSQLKVKYVLIGILSWIFIEAFGIARGVVSSSSSFDFIQLFELAASNAELGIRTVAGGSDFSHPFITFFEITREEQAGFMMGKGILDGLTSLLPSFLLEEKPQTMAQWFAAKYYPTFSKQGGGTASSLVAEIWLNFGSIIAPFVAGFLISLFLFWVQLKAKVKSSGLTALSVPYFTFSLFFLERVGLVASFKQFIYMFVPFLCFVFSFKILSLITRR